MVMVTMGITSISFSQEKQQQSRNKAEVIGKKLSNNSSTKALCAVGVDCSDDDVIKKVVLNTIDNPTSCSTNGYGDYSSMSTFVPINILTNIAVTVGNGWETEQVAIWIDLDNSETFDMSEFQYIGEGPNSTINGTFTIPEGTAVGSYTIRVMVYAGVISSDLGCYNDVEDYGEFEDYTLEVVYGGVGIASVSSDAREVYPNPAKNSISINGLVSNANIQIIDVTGRTVISSTTIGNEIHTISLEDLKEGNYQVKITSATGTTVKQIIKK